MPYLSWTSETQIRRTQDGSSWRTWRRKASTSAAELVCLLASLLRRECRESSLLEGRLRLVKEGRENRRHSPIG